MSEINMSKMESIDTKQPLTQARAKAIFRTARDTFAYASSMCIQLDGRAVSAWQINQSGMWSYMGTEYPADVAVGANSMGLLDACVYTPQGEMYYTEGFGGTLIVWEIVLNMRVEAIGICADKSYSIPVADGAPGAGESIQAEPERCSPLYSNGPNVGPTRSTWARRSA